MIKAISNLTNSTIQSSDKTTPTRLRRNPRHFLRALILVAVILGASAVAKAQTNYVFYNGTYNYLYNDNGTLKSGGLRFDKSSVWTASGSLGTISSFTDDNQLYTSTNNGGTVSLRASGSTWYQYNNYLSTRSNGWGNTTYYYLKASNATSFTTASGNNGSRYTPYSVTIDDILPGLSSFEITGGQDRFNSTGSSTFGHTNALYCDQAYTHYSFNGNNYYVNESNATTTTAPGTTITTASAYTWSLSDNANGYATVTNSGVVTISSIPTSGNLTITLTCTVTYNNHTATATKNITLSQTGVSGGKVTLDDREDHSWSYYSDASLPAELRSLNPADVTITYFGNGTNNVNVTTNSTTPADNSWTSSSSSVQVSNNETANTFVYYKTLERTDGSTSLNPTGRCAYTVIPNPFSKRPTFTISGTKYYTGFYKWKVTKLEGGAIYDAKTGGNSIAVGGTIDGDQTVYFAPNSEYGMVVEMVALWARAYVTTGSGNLSTRATGTNAYERNFHIVTENNQTVSNYQKTYPLTISSRYPDGSNGGGSFKAGDFTAAADTKFEYVNVGNGTSNTYTADNHSLIIGRGITGTINYLRGLKQGSTSSWGGTTYQDYSSNLDYTIRVESGTIKYLAFLAGYNAPDDSDLSAYTRCTGSSNLVKGILGCDFDRALGAGNNGNDNLTVTQSVFYGNRVTMANQDANSRTLDLCIKSGKFMTALNNNMGTGDAGHSIYLAIASYGDNTKTGERFVTIEGGEMGNIAGGVDVNQSANSGVRSITLRMKGGTVKGAVYGGGAVSPAWGDRHMVFTGGTVNGWIGGGCNGVVAENTTGGGQTKGVSYVYVGGNTHVGGSSTINGAEGGNVFGAGKGSGSSDSDEAESGEMTYGTNLVIADDVDILHSVYGGGYYGYAKENTILFVCLSDNGIIRENVFGGSNLNNGPAINMTIKGSGTINGGIYGGSRSKGNVSSVTMNISGNKIDQGVFGGGYGTNSVSCDVTGAVGITMTNGTILSGLYGGGNVNSKIGGKATININGGIIGSSTTSANVYGGGLGELTRAKGTVEINIGTATTTNNTTTYSGNAVIYGDVYGGSAKGVTNCNDGGTALATGTKTDVTLNSGTINGSLYGGGHGISGANANVWGPVTVTVNKGKVTDAVFGCNNENGTPKNSVSVTINGTDAATQGYALNEVYGGGNKASYVPGNGVTGYPKVEVTGCDNSIGVVYGGGNAADVPSTDVTIWGGTIGQVFGGGHGNKNANPQTEANVSGNVAVKIYGGTIDEVFAGSNSKGSINGNSCQVTIENQGSCDMDITDVYGGGNEADGKAGTLSIGCGAVVSGNIYGGAKNAAISNNITLNITGGNLNNIFGGNNQGGNISGTITVNIEKADNCNTWHIGTVYGGGNVAAYTAPNGSKDYPQVNIKKGAISGSVYGGGLGSLARVTGNPQVKVTGGTITGNIYGGGEAAPVTGNPVLTLSGNNTSAADIYGGGKGTTAVVTGNSSVTVSGGTYSNVFGGGEAANLSGSVTVNIQGGTISNDVYGGGALAHTNTANQNGNVITPKTNTTTVNLTGGTMKNVYGGGLGNTTTEAKVYGDVFVNLNKGVSSDSRGAAVTDYLFGCNNVNGTPLGSVTVYVQGTQNSGLQSMLVKNNDSYDMKAIYGGGNLAAYIPYADTASTHVIINGCRTVSTEYVYGGGNAASVPATEVQMYGSYKIGSIFGGGNGKDDLPNGDPNPGADVGIYKVTQEVYDATPEYLRYLDPGHEKGDDKYILYGNIAGTSIIGTTNVTFLGGNVDHLFGGSNTKGDIIKQANVILGDEDLQTCDFHVNDVYGGSNEAYMSGSASIDMNCIEGMNEIYGGSRMADVNNDIVLTISGGRYEKVFGGNNISGRIFGSITVNIEQTGCLPIVIGELYGGGNEAPYSVFGYTGNTLNESGSRWADPTINIISCESIGKVFGGGLGAQAVVIGDPHININMIKGWTNGDYKGNGEIDDPHAAYKLTKKVSDNVGVIGTVFGGGNEAVVKGQTFVNIGTQTNVTVKNVTKAVYNAIKNDVPGIANPGFANNDGDAVTKDLTIQVQGANITGNVYGGGNNADVTGATNVQLGH